MTTQTLAGGEIPQLVPLRYENGFDTGLKVSARDNLEHALSLGLPELKPHPVRAGKCVIVAGAPSIKDHLETIRAMANEPGSYVFAVNQAHDWLIDNGIRVDAVCLYEIASDPYRDIFTRPSPDTQYFVGSLSFPSMLDDLIQDRKKITLWHVYTEEPEQLDLLRDHGAFMVGGGTATLLRSINIAMIQGYRDFALFGCDSSFSDDSHITGKPYQNTFELIEVYAGSEGKKFKTYPYLARQADEFRGFCKQFHWMLKLKVFGGGLLPFIHRTMYPQIYEGDT